MPAGQAFLKKKRRFPQRKPLLQYYYCCDLVSCREASPLRVVCGASKIIKVKKAVRKKAYCIHKRRRSRTHGTGRHRGSAGRYSRTQVFHISAHPFTKNTNILYTFFISCQGVFVIIRTFFAFSDKCMDKREKQAHFLAKCACFFVSGTESDKGNCKIRRIASKSHGCPVPRCCRP